ncbi:type I-E CRISPR-associated protein Cas7/Cse4/CasC [Corynebacterium sp. HMSC072G08]|uniref:type I-E CRISPR-associated protein Cas7/Cse4/CasC n=1 Tax=Corynebacterium sp. HMSC072G08 TaxID=1715039 RepID=UPI0008A5AD72|nr:type I-E CRISPR-associated protein Cas7/Cse4/CasC [Corynebacterium sp. HMSC072G08]OFN42294.1 type I-E CRISPR-associated protein Cas7/Cse4/CasC [Corynebacterium sp. HMSC072G08]
MSRHLTISILTSIPYSNLNRDDTGVPKRTMHGGVLRALHSSQAIKRGIRLRYEDASGQISIRSGKLAEVIVEKALELAPDLDEGAALKTAKKIVGALTKAKATENESDRSTWLSGEELLTAATHIVQAQEGESADDVANMIAGHKTGSLAIAAFGRMFANAPGNNTEAALSVSPAITTHAATIDTDYFSTVDDIREQNHETGATFLGVSQYTSGVFYRTISIDKQQLRESWSGFTDPQARGNLEELIRAVIYGQPRGKENSTAPYTLPALVLAEEQQYRTAYDFDQPVQSRGNGGFLAPSVDALAEQYALAREFDSRNFGPAEVLAGTYKDLEGKFGNLKSVSLDNFIEQVVGWILND